MADEENKVSESKSEVVGKEDEVDPSPSSSVEMLRRADEAATRLEEANERMKELIKQQEELAIEAKLGGKTLAGAPVKTEEEKAIDAAKDLIKGSGFEDDIFKDEE